MENCLYYLLLFYHEDDELIDQIVDHSFVVYEWQTVLFDMSINDVFSLLRTISGLG